MNPLVRLIYDDDLSDAATVLAAITARSIRTIVFSGDQTVARYTQAYGVPATATLMLTLKTAVAAIRVAGQQAGTPEAEAAAEAQALILEQYGQKYLISGLDLSDHNTQATFDSMVPALGQTIVDNVKALGVQWISRCQQADISPDPDLAAITAAIAEVNQRKAAGAYWARVLAVVNPMIDAGNSADEIKTAAAGVV